MPVKLVYVIDQDLSASLAETNCQQQKEGFDLLDTECEFFAAGLFLAQLWWSREAEFSTLTISACRSNGYSGNYISQTLPFANTAYFTGERKDMYSAGYGVVVKIFHGCDYAGRIKRTNKKH